MKVTESWLDRLVEWFIEMQQRALREGIELSPLSVEEIADFMCVE